MRLGQAGHFKGSQFFLSCLRLKKLFMDKLVFNWVQGLFDLWTSHEVRPLRCPWRPVIKTVIKHYTSTLSPWISEQSHTMFTRPPSAGIWASYKITLVQEEGQRITGKEEWLSSHSPQSCHLVSCDLAKMYPIRFNMPNKECRDSGIKCPGQKLGPRLLQINMYWERSPCRNPEGPSTVISSLPAEWWTRRAEADRTVIVTAGACADNDRFPGKCRPT